MMEHLYLNTSSSSLGMCLGNTYTSSYEYKATNKTRRLWLIVDPSGRVTEDTPGVLASIRVEECWPGEVATSPFLPLFSAAKLSTLDCLQKLYHGPFTFPDQGMLVKVEKPS